MFRSHRLWAVALVAAPFTAPAHAADVDKLLPPDTEVLITINVKQLLASDLLKKAGLEQWKEGLKSVDLANEILQDLGFDPFKDLDRVTVASPGGADKDRGLVIIQGNFNTAKFKAKADDTAKTNAEALKTHTVPDGKDGQQLVYEAIIPGQDLPLFVAVASKDVLFASPGKDYVADAVKKLAVKGGGPLKNKDMQALLQKMDAKQSLSIAGLAAALRKDPNLPDGVKNSLEKFDAIGGGLTLTDEIKLEIVLSAKSADAAKDLEKSVSDVLNQGLGMAALFAGQKKEFAPAIDVLKSIRSSAKGKLVTIKAQIGADILDKALGKDK